MIRPCKSLKKVLICRKPVDFRKAVNGLSILIHHDLDLNAFEGVYVFFNRRRDKVKILTWESNGFVLYAKYLEQDKFHIPKGDEDIVMITGEQMHWLLDGININLIKPHRPIVYQEVG